MKIDLSCEIVRDLLPNYIDGLASESTVKSVEAHLQQCKECCTVYNIMKEEDSKELYEELSPVEAEKTLFKKINNKLNKKVRSAVMAGIVGIAFVIGVTQLLFNVSLMEVPIDDIRISAAVYPLENLVRGIDQDTSDNSVVISKDNSQRDETFYSISIPNMSNAEIAISQSVINSCGYLTYISWESPYLLRDIEWEIRTVDNQKIMYVTGFKTTLLNNKVPSNGYIMPMMELQKLDKIVYVEGDGTENVLWENDAE